MISLFRNKIKSKGFQLILWLALFSLVGGLGFLQNLVSKKKTYEIASVDGSNIEVNEFQRSYQTLVQTIQQIRSLYGKNADSLLKMFSIDISKNPAEVTLNQLIDQKVVQNAAKSIGISTGNSYAQEKLADPMYVRQYLSNLVPVQAYEDNKLNTELVTQFLTRQGISLDDFSVMLKETIDKNLLMDLIKGATYVPVSALKEKYLQSIAKKKFNILELDVNNYIKKAESNKYTEKDIEDYFNENKDSYLVSPKRSANLWEFTPENYNVNVSDNDITDYYNKYKKDYILKAQEITAKTLFVKESSAAEQILKQLKENLNSFDDIAKAQSLPLETMVIDKYQKDNPVNNAAYLLSKQNPLSSVIKAKNGYYIVKFLDKTEAQYKNIDQVKEEITKKLAQQKFKTEFSKNASIVINQSIDNIAALEKFIQSKKASKSTINDVSQENTTQSEKLFDLKKLKNMTYYQDDNKGYIIELTKISKSYIPKLSDIKDKVIKDYYKDQAIKLLNNDLNLIKQSNSFSDQLAKQYNAKLIHTNWIDIGNNDLKEIKDKNLPSDLISTLIIKGQKVIYTNDKHGYILQLSEIEDIKNDDFVAKSYVLKSELIQNQLNNMTQNLLSDWRKKAKININNELFQQVTHISR